MTAIVERKDDGLLPPCPELDIASRGPTIEKASAILVEALTPFFETASDSEFDRIAASLDC